MDLKNSIALISWMVICQLAGVVGSLYTRSAIPVWYASLQKPWFNPPGWIFGPVWVLLYALMAIAVFLVWKKRSGNSRVKTAIEIFLVQLMLNALWSVIFFGMHSISAAFIEIIILWIFIVVTIRLFFPISRTAGYLLIPYLIWVSFALLLNYAFMILNE